MLRIKLSFIPIVIGILLLPITFPIYNKEVVIKVNKGENLDKIIKKLTKARVIQDPYGFKILVLLSKKNLNLSYGWYKLNIYENPRSVLEILSKGKRMTVKVTILEGLRAYQILNLLERQTDMDVKKMDFLIHNRNFILTLGIDANSLEGYLFPDTYIFYMSEEPEQVLKKMVYRMFSILKPNDRIMIGSMEFNTHQILTIASLIEKEAMVGFEKPLIASVIYNRLKKRMPLQIDATILFALGQHKARVYYRDLKVQSPYNTYQHRGLPPGPIANPGYQSILAALHPAKTDYYYYVATGKGDHIFTETYEEHIKAKRKIRNK